MTPEHPVLAIRQKLDISAKCRAHGVRRCRRCTERYTPADWIKAADLKKGDFVAHRYAPTGTIDVPLITTTDYVTSCIDNGATLQSTKQQRIIKNQIGTYDIGEKTWLLTGTAIPSKIPTSHEFMRLVGYYLAEGSVGHAFKKNPSTIVFSISMEEALGDMGADISHCCDVVFGHRPKTYRDKVNSNGAKLVLYNALAARFFKALCPGTCRTKQMPAWMLKLPVEKQQQLLIGFFRGDGWYKNHQRSKSLSFGIAGEQLAYQFTALLERCGATATFNHRQVLNKRLQRKFDRYTVTVQASSAAWLWDAMGAPAISVKPLDFSVKKDGYIFRRIDSIRYEPFTGDVYNIEVETDHSYIVNGVAVHNCDSPVPLNCSCFLPGTRVLMWDGTTKAIENITQGDLVVTHRGRYRKVVRLFRTPHNGPIYRWKADKHSGEAFNITGNHPVLALQREVAFTPAGRARKAVKEVPQWTSANKLGVGDLVVRRRSHNSIVDIQTIDLLALLGPGFVERNGLIFSCRTTGSRSGQIDGMANGIPRYLPVNDDLLDLLGYYAAEGCADPKNGVRFTVHNDEMTFGDIGAEICRILASLFGLEPKINNRATPNARDIQIFSPALVAFFRAFGKKKDKKFPTWIIDLPPAKQARVVAALLKGDGYIARRTGGIYLQLGLASRNLIDQTLFMAERCGWEPAHQPITVNNNRIRHRLSITASAAPDLCDLMGIERTTKKLSRERRAGGHVLHRIQEWSQLHYEGTVYNFEVEDDNSYIVDGIVVHNCEECQQIFWLQDETDVAAIRPPSCGGKLPGVNAYGELKIYLFPESTIADPNNPATTLNKKDNYPSLIFKRYDDTITPGTGEFDLVLKRDKNNKRQTEVGWAFTPGALGVAQCVWFAGKDNDGNQIRFELSPQAEPALLGTILYKGHLLTKKMGVIVDYTSTILSTNQYTVREWDVDGQKAVGDPLTAKNIWQYANPENPPSGKNPKTLLLDSGVDLLPIGTLVDLWFFKVGEVAGEPIRRFYFSKKPTVNPNHIWTWVGQCQFGDALIARNEVLPGPGSEDKGASAQVSSIRNFERHLWGLTGYDDPLIAFDVAATAGTDRADLSRQHRAVIDNAIPALKVIPSVNTPDDFSERPIWLWNRKDVCNALIRADIGRPGSSLFSPYDIVLRAPIDESTNLYMRVVGKGVINGLYYIRVAGVHFQDLPPFGTIRVLYPDSNQNLVYNYHRKLMFPSNVNSESIGTAGTVPAGSTEPPGGFPPNFNSEALDTVVLIGSAADNLPYPGDIGDIVELLHQEYNSPCVRVEFSFNPATGLIEVQFKVGILDMGLPYEEDVLADDADDYVRGLAPGYAVSAIYSQAGPFTGVGSQPDASPEGFVVYEGGAQVGGTLSEYWNHLEIMLRDNQVWVWWNKLLIPPSTTLSAALPTPVTISTPFFPLEQDPNRQFGKVGVRLWPGATVRRLDVRTQISLFSEFVYGQLEVS
jgi:intein/homing endonuclease